MAVSAGRPAVFLDKDGTLIQDEPYNVDPRLIRFTPGAGEALRRLHRLGYSLVVVSNQSGVARGYFEKPALRHVERALCDMVRECGAELAGFYYCPHLPDGTVTAFSFECECRKPAPGMLLAAATDLGIDLNRSWLIGDILDDVEAGRGAGCRTILLDCGSETEWRLGFQRTPDFIAADLLEAAGIIAANALPPGRDSEPLARVPA